jgi:FkbM family methyltransferase
MASRSGRVEQLARELLSPCGDCFGVEYRMLELDLAGPRSQLDAISETLNAQPSHQQVLPLSYAQNLEDYHLSLAFADQQTGTYIDIGGGHPVAGSVSFWFYQRGWQGIVVEPQERLASIHRRVRPRDTVVGSLIGRQTGTADLFVVDKFHALTTTVEAYAANAKGLGVEIQPVKVPMLSLAELCAAHGIETIDFLKIDVEGAEADVIAGGDWRRHRPKVVLVEAIKPLSNEPAWDAWEGMLLAHGYKFALFDTLNRFYVAEEHPDILARLPSERASWDSVRHMYEIGRAGDNAAHPDHQLARALMHGFLARLPHLAPELLATCLDRESTLSRDDCQSLQQMLANEELRMRLGRIACGYDGGQLSEDPSA